MKKRNMYLSELFLGGLGGDYSIKSLKKALSMCNKEFLKRLSKEKLNCKQCLSCYKQELLDFYDVYSEFDEELDFSFKNKFFILQQIQYV